MNLASRRYDSSPDLPLDVLNPSTLSSALAWQTLAQRSIRMPTKPEPTAPEAIVGTLLHTGPLPQLALREAVTTLYAPTPDGLADPFDSGLHSLRQRFQSRTGSSLVASNGGRLSLTPDFPTLDLSARAAAQTLAAQRRLHHATAALRAELANAIAQDLNLSPEAQRFLGALLGRSPFSLSLGARADRATLRTGRRELMSALHESGRYNDLISNHQDGQVDDHALRRALESDGIDIDQAPRYSNSYLPVAELLLPERDGGPHLPETALEWYEDPAPTDAHHEWASYADALDQALRPLEWLHNNGIAEVEPRLNQLLTLLEQADAQLETLETGD